MRINTPNQVNTPPVLICTGNINNTPVDGYYNNKNAWFSRIQIGEALEYSEPQKAIDNIHSRHKERLDKFSRIVKLNANDGKSYDTYIYNLRGVLEICRWSRQPKADAVMDALYDMAEEVIEKGYYSCLSPEALTELVASNAIRNHNVLNRIVGGQLRQDVKQAMKNDRYNKFMELLTYHFQELSIRDFVEECKKIYDGYPSELNKALSTYRKELRKANVL